MLGCESFPMLQPCVTYLYIKKKKREKKRELAKEEYGRKRSDVIPEGDLSRWN